MAIERRLVEQLQLRSTPAETIVLTVIKTLHPVRAACRVLKKSRWLWLEAVRCRVVRLERLEVETLRHCAGQRSVVILGLIRDFYGLEGEAHGFSRILVAAGQLHRGNQRILQIDAEVIGLAIALRFV